MNKLYTRWWTYFFLNKTISYVNNFTKIHNFLSDRFDLLFCFYLSFFLDNNYKIKRLVKIRHIYYILIPLVTKFPHAIF